ncbi:uncharacterized protein LOC125036045 [Penaeus chinensis]|uniref:uncharacterized protein LOC125036045 n=1 Tax=Penaeus chinensis TaxID=139456 RepID=UPI001FB5D012|nr:uncharacterized protein LOC125036045 [Penaeus chinensis]XP_047484368.1 uncharacterized protein LOC125036045 [Penaeus chinensis]
MAEAQEVWEAAGVKFIGPHARHVDLDENVRFVFLSLVWTSRKWGKCLAQITAVCGEDSLDAYVRPTRTKLLDSKYLKWAANLEWDGSTMKKGGIPIPADDILELEAAMTLLVEWLREKKPVVCVVGDFMLIDSCLLVNLLCQAGLYNAFASVCRGFISGFTILQHTHRWERQRNVIFNARRLRDAIQAIDCDLQFLQEKSLTVECVQEYHADTERTYWARTTFKVLYDEEVITRSHARRLAVAGWTFKDMKEIYKNDGEEVLKYKLGLVTRDVLVNLQGTVNPDVLSERNINDICNFLKKNK